MVNDYASLVAASRDVPSFAGAWREPVDATGGVEAPGVVQEIVERYDRHGFAVLQLADGAGEEKSLPRTAAALSLGDPYLPPLYQLGSDRPAPAVSRISAAFNAGTSDGRHPSFGRTNGQHLHTDGTLQDIGHIRTTLLVCQSQGVDGGHTTLFNSTAAYARLLRQDPAAASALATSGALVRQANINGCADENHGPVFAVVEGELLTRYSVTATDRFEVPSGVDPDDLRRGVDAMVMAAAEPEFFLQATLSADQMLVLANSRVSHGRTPYRDSATQRRCMFRSLHTVPARISATA
ncbi:TauD/TfdA family dioxygenase [Micromonospora sp. DT43]|uniref:TauD/TfdA family dioxygenase n=1 Tax=Micromonospora sp. DT43 TaxID=3393440 RepID=UPI003CEB4240